MLGPPRGQDGGGMRRAVIVLTLLAGLAVLGPVAAAMAGRSW
jgi:hypothetical protein